MVKSLSVSLVFVIYCLLNIYEDQLMSASLMWPIANTCADISLCTINFTVLPHKKLFSPINTDIVCQKTSLKLIHYYTLLFMTSHIDARNNNITSYFIIKQAIKLDGFTSKQYWRTTLLSCKSW